MSGLSPPKKTKKTVIIFMDTDKHASPFDILTAVDLFPEAHILYYGDVNLVDAQKIVQDAMFPRGPGGAKQTKIFIGGQDVEKAHGILDVAKKSMFPPFELAVIVDPRGANTTASAAVAKTIVLYPKEIESFDEITIAVLAGTGPVGQVIARLCAIEGMNVIITSRKMQRAMTVANKINEETGTEKVCGMQASQPDEIGEAIKQADIVLASGAGGIRLLPLKVLRDYGKSCKVVGDINAIPPLGVEGLKQNDEGVEILPGILGIGALAIGSFKAKIEAELFKRAVASPKGIFDYKVTYEIAKNMS